MGSLLSPPAMCFQYLATRSPPSRGPAPVPGISGSTVAGVGSGAKKLRFTAPTWLPRAPAVVGPSWSSLGKALCLGLWPLHRCSTRLDTTHFNVCGTLKALSQCTWVQMTTEWFCGTLGCSSSSKDLQEPRSEIAAPWESVYMISQAHTDSCLFLF